MSTTAWGGNGEDFHSHGEKVLEWAESENLSRIYPESAGGILGKFERVIHISYKLSTVFEGLSTVLERAISFLGAEHHAFLF